MRYFLLLVLLGLCLKIRAQAPDFLTPFEKDINSTATYQESIDYYERMAAAYNQLEVKHWGATDAGFPLSVAVLSKNGQFDPVLLKKQDKRILFINNAIHPGEPEGVDATMMLVRDYLQQPGLQSFLDRVVLVVIPYYNIGGGINRGPDSRANQNGPEEYGFRGNAKNLDLNRDFIKCDSKNAQTFNQVFNHWQPDVFIDNHTSNGADYTYTMTMLTTQEDKLGPVLGGYVRRHLLPDLYQNMAARNWEMTPYVNVWGSTPDKGISGFNDSPRYASGYGAAHHVISFVPETHMLKPYPDRLRATYAFMDVLIKTMSKRADEIGEVRNEARKAYQAQSIYPLDWKIDRSRADTLTFKGYAAKYKPSEVTGQDRLWYDRTSPFTGQIPYWNHFVPAVEVEKPVAYLIPQAYPEVIDRLRWNGVEVRLLGETITPEVEMYYIKNYKDRNAYEGHYLHHSVEVEKQVMQRPYYAGDFVVFTDQPALRYILETLEPQAPDSYFAWNFFDGILGQKEYFSAYVFEDKAAEFLKENPAVRTALEAKKAADPEFAKSSGAQLYFVYTKTPYYERTHRLYPVGRWMGEGSLPLK